MYFFSPHHFSVFCDFRYFRFELFLRRDLSDKIQKSRKVSSEKLSREVGRGERGEEKREEKRGGRRGGGREERRGEGRGERGEERRGGEREVSEGNMATILMHTIQVNLLFSP